MMVLRMLFTLLLTVFGLMMAGCSQPIPAEPSPLSASPLSAAVRSSALLPNLLVQAEGNVQLRRAGRRGFLPTGFGVTAEPGDLLRVAKEGAAAIFCGDESLWDASPWTLPADGAEHGIPCVAGRPPRPAPSISQLRSLRGDAPDMTGEIPYVLSPRSGWVLNDRPTLRWHALSNVDSYTMTLVSDDGQQRPPVTHRFPAVTQGSVELSYPETWPSLEAGSASYQLRVEGSGRRSDEGGVFGQGFSLLDSIEAVRVNDQIERLRQRPLSQSALTLLLTELYLGHGLRSEAIEMLRSLPGDDQAAAIQQLLGETYLAMGLFVEAEAAFERALAQAGDLPEAQAAAHVGLGQAACGQWQEARAKEQWQAARAQYQALEMAARVDEIAKWLEKAAENCLKERGK